jgi:polyhydroxybutyrate depolymerase
MTDDCCWPGVRRMPVYRMDRVRSTQRRHFPTLRRMVCEANAHTFVKWEIVVKKILRFVLRLLMGGVALIAILAVLAGYFLYTPNPELPPLSGAVTAGNIVIDGRTRTYQAYVPKGLSPGAPLILAMHGSGETGAALRFEMGYSFERLADERGFAVVYPNGQNGHWNTCEIDKDAPQPGIDDVRFLTALADKFIGEIGSDRNRVFGVGLSEGGYMAIRLALEAPSRFRAVAPVAANLSLPKNFQCRPVTQGGTSMILIHGTKDPLVPYDGREGSLLFGLISNSKSQSTQATAQYFADLNGILGGPVTTRSISADGFGIERSVWGSDAVAEVELVAIEGAGHVFPQPFYRARRILGPSPRDPNAAKVIWAFFERQMPR